MVLQMILEDDKSPGRLRNVSVPERGIYTSSPHRLLLQALAIGLFSAQDCS